MGGEAREAVWGNHDTLVTHSGLFLSKEFGLFDQPWNFILLFPGYCVFLASPYRWHTQVLPGTKANGCFLQQPHTRAQIPQIPQ